MRGKILCKALVVCLLLAFLAGCAGGGFLSRHNGDARGRGAGEGQVVGAWATVLEF